MIVFRTNEKVYRASTGVEIVRALEGDEPEYPYAGQSVRTFLRWSLRRLGDHIPPRDLELSDRMEDEALALNYLYLRDEYGTGTLSIPTRNGKRGSVHKEEPMKIMVAYDGSVYADAAIDNLVLAGLPHGSQVLVTSVADASASRPVCSEFDLVSAASRRFDTVLTRGRRHAEKVLRASRELARAAAGRIRRHSPKLAVRYEVSQGDPAEELLAVARRWNPDLIVVGSQGRSALGRFFLGSVSKSLAENAETSVRVARHRAAKTDVDPIEIIAGATNPGDAERIVAALARRTWPRETHIQLIGVDDGFSPGRVSAFYPDGRSIYETLAEPLVAAGLDVAVKVESGDPKSVLIEAAEESNADAIVVVAQSGGGETGLDETARGLILDVGHTVEIVR